jgi:alpha-L-rhamnosidase
VTRADITGNTAVYRWIPFGTTVSTTQVRVVVTAARASFSRIGELAP